MGLFAIADLHLSADKAKPMDIFGDHWRDHVAKIEKDWLENIREEDCVLIPGDISWAMTMEEAQADLQWIHDLPGTKVLLRGNHDYWWGSIKRLNSLYSDLFFIQNNYTVYQDYAICGARGWLCPGHKLFTAHDQKVYLRECERLKLSLEAANKAGRSKKIVIMHFPPVNEDKQSSCFTQLCESYGVSRVLYGHLHHTKSFEKALIGRHKGIRYDLVSCDYLNFKLFKIF